MPPAVRFHMPPATAVIALALLAAAMLIGRPVAAQSDSSSCAAEGAVADAANNPGLVSDCNILLAARDTLAGTASLNWSASTSINDWEGVTVDGSQPRGLLDWF